VFLQLVTDGATITEAAEQSGIGRRTVYEWRDQFEDFAEKLLVAEKGQFEKFKEKAKGFAVNGVTTTKIVKTFVPVYPKDADGKIVEGSKAQMVLAGQEESEIKSIPIALLNKVLAAGDPTYRNNPPPAENQGKSVDDLIEEASKIPVNLKAKK